MRGNCVHPFGLREDVVNLPSEFTSRPLAYYVWGASRRSANTFAHALAAHLDREFLWWSVREPGAPTTDDAERAAALLPRERALDPVTPEDLVPDDAISNLASWTATRGPRAESPAEVAELLDFLRLPQSVRSVAQGLATDGAPRCLAIANADRVRALYPGEPEGLRRYCRALTTRGIAVVVTSGAPPNPGRFGFDVVLRLENFPAGAWRTGRVAVEQGLERPPFRTGAVIDLSEVPAYRAAAEALERSGGNGGRAPGTPPPFRGPGAR